MYPSPISIARAQNGDRGAWRELCERVQDLLFAHALALTGDPAHAEAAALDGLVEAHRRLEEVRDAEQFPRWLLRLVERRHDRARNPPAPDPDGARAADDPLSGVRALPRLEERSAFLLVHLGGRAPDDVARFLGVTPSEVQSRLAVAERRLKKSTVRRLGPTLVALRPSRDAAFVGLVLRRCGLGG